nr:MAG TPA: hypothetical protein [Caudoviricetes sp.]
MNLYLCTDDLHEAGLYVAAESRGKAKCMYCDYCDSLLDFIMVHTYIMRRDFEAPAGVYDENCEALEAAGVRYCEED